MMWRKGRWWYVGLTSDLGKAFGFISVIGNAPAPEAVSKAWQAYSDENNKWKDVPEVRCLHGDSLAAEMAKAAPRIALVGPTPGGLQTAKLGLFTKRTDLVNGYPSYTKDGDDKYMMWHSCERWWVGLASELGKDFGFVTVFDGALAPESARAAWRVWDNKAKAWLGAPEVRVLTQSVAPSQRVWSVNQKCWLDMSDLIVFEGASAPAS